MKQTKRQIRRETAQLGYYHRTGQWVELTQLERDKTLLKQVIGYGIPYSWTNPVMLIALENLKVMHKLDILMDKILKRYHQDKDKDFYYNSHDEIFRASNKIYNYPLGGINEGKEVLAKYDTILSP